MRRLALRTLGLLLMLPAASPAQVKIMVSEQHYKAHEEIRARVENDGSQSVTFCIEFGQTSTIRDEYKSTPMPFLVQRNSNGKWDTLMIGPDVGTNRAAVVLDAGEFKQFSFSLNDSGRIRLRLNYWSGSLPDLECRRQSKGSKRVTSPVFTIE